MEPTVIRSDSAERTEGVGALLAPLLMPGDVVSLSGDLGAGKTVLVKGVARGLGVPDSVTSPTFNILLVHEGRLTLHHLDLYRLEEQRQLEDIDFWGVLESGGASIIEWGDRFPAALPQDVLHVALSILADDTRELAVRATGPRSTALAEAWVRECEGAGAE